MIRWNRWRRLRNRGLTVVEVLIALIIISVLASLAIPSFMKAVEESKDKEAQTILRLIRTAERIYRLKYNFYYTGPESVVSALNSSLRLNIESPERNWDYEVLVNGVSDFRARATRLSPPVNYERKWEITKDGDPVKTDL